MEQYLRSIGQIFASVGANNPRHNKLGKLDFWLGRKLVTYAKRNPSPNASLPNPRLCPPSPGRLPPSRNAQTKSHQKHGMYCFLLPPQARIILQGQRRHRPLFFLLRYLQFFIFQQPINAASASAGLATRDSADFSSLLFTAKNVSRKNPLATAAQAIPKAVRWQHCIAVLHTFNVMAPPARLLSRRCNTRKSGLRSGSPI